MSKIRKKVTRDHVNNEFYSCNAMFKLMYEFIHLLDKVQTSVDRSRRDSPTFLFKGDNLHASLLNFCNEYDNNIRVRLCMCV